MRFNRNSFLNQKIPRLLGIIVLLLSFGTIFWLSRNVVLFDSKAALGNTPKNIKISNVSTDSASISFVTDGSVQAHIAYGTDSALGQVQLDERDKDTSSPHTVHFFTLKNLTGNTKYLFSIISGDGTFLNNNIPYEITTPSTPPAGSAKTVNFSGDAKTTSGNPPAEAIVYLETDNSQLYSTLIKPDGKYNFEIKNFITSDLTKPIELNENSKLKMTITDGISESKVLFFADFISPLPSIILSKDYDFTIDLASSSASESAQISGFPTIAHTQELTVPQILTPVTNEKFEDQQPLFEGKALPENDVEIIIESEHPITTTVQADKNGNWQFRPSTKLAPGEHTITIKTLNANGIIQTIKRSFTVYAEGSQFTEPSVSPQATLTPTQTPQPTPTTTTATPTPQVATPLPTATASPTTQPTPTPTTIVLVPTITETTSSITPSPTSIITVPPIPDAGSAAVVFGILGTILAIGIGGLIFLLL